MRAMNRFKKFIDKQSYSNAQILATKIWNINFSAEFTPYTHIIIFNHNATVTLEVTPNGAAIGDDTVQAVNYTEKTRAQIVTSFGQQLTTPLPASYGTYRTSLSPASSSRTSPR